jgi:hypothetical protein
VQIQQLIRALQLSLRLTHLVEQDSYDSSEKKNRLEKIKAKKNPAEAGFLDWSRLLGILSYLDSLGL